MLTKERYRQKLKKEYIKNNLLDPVLKQGEAWVPDGEILPFRIAGGPAVIFKINVGNVSYALKCWDAVVPELDTRFPKIDNYLNSLKTKNLLPPYFIDFKFNNKGFKGDNNDFLPILRMEWVDGDTLTNFVKTNYHDKYKIKDIACQFLEMVKQLHNMNISHGDLHGGNIMIKKDGKICLIDYDGICTPDLRDEKDNTGGFPGFQHPSNKKDLGLMADYFSELVIYLSLLVFSENVNFAKTIDRQWLFKKNDLENTNSSQIFQDLIKMTPNIRYLTQKLKDYCQTDALKLQPLENIIETTTQPPSLPILITAISNNTAFGTVSVSGNEIKATPNYRVGYASPAYEITNGNATVIQSGNKFIVTAINDSEIQINFEDPVYVTIVCNQCGTTYNNITAKTCYKCGNYKK